MRVVSYGAGAVGGVVAGRLAEHGHDVVVIARGAHLDAIRRDGLRVDCPDGSVTVAVPAVGSPAEVDWREGDVVLLGVKGQDTVAALDELRAAAPDVAVVCLQNGVENERQALRRFERVYGVCVMLPTGHLDPGVVLAYSSPITGLLDIGRYPMGVDALAEEVAAALATSSFESIPRPDIMRWKHNKLLMNLGNSVEAALGVEGRFSELAARVREEGVAVLTAAGIPFASDEEDAERRGSKLSLRPIEGQRRGGGSTWQSLARGTGTIEADFLNGEIVLLGRLHGVATPANALMQEVAVEMARAGAAPGTVDEAALMARLGDPRRG